MFPLASLRLTQESKSPMTPVNQKPRDSKESEPAPMRVVSAEPSDLKPPSAPFRPRIMFSMKRGPCTVPASAMPSARAAVTSARDLVSRGLYCSRALNRETKKPETRPPSACQKSEPSVSLRLA